jgi:hypothetical protein
VSRSSIKLATLHNNNNNNNNNNRECRGMNYLNLESKSDIIYNKKESYGDGATDY